MFGRLCKKNTDFPCQKINNLIFVSCEIKYGSGNNITLNSTPNTWLNSQQQTTSRLRWCQMIFNSFLTVQSYVRQLNNRTNRTTAHGVYSVINCRLIADWLVGNMNSDVTPCLILYFNILLTKRKRYNKHLILTILMW
jgi:hypothetical protein